LQGATQVRPEQSGDLLQSAQVHGEEVVHDDVEADVEQVDQAVEFLHHVAGRVHPVGLPEVRRRAESAGIGAAPGSEGPLGLGLDAWPLPLGEGNPVERRDQEASSREPGPVRGVVDQAGHAGEVRGGQVTGALQERDDLLKGELALAQDPGRKRLGQAPGQTRDVRSPQHQGHVQVSADLPGHGLSLGEVGGDGRDPHQVGPPIQGLGQLLEQAHLHVGNMGFGPGGEVGQAHGHEDPIGAGGVPGFQEGDAHRLVQARGQAPYKA